jgi:hypothetical protein
MKPSPRRWAPRLLSLGLSFGLALLLAECLARRVGPTAGEDLLFNAPDATPAGMYAPDPVLLLAPVPGFEGEVAGLGRRVRIRFNALGLRGADPGGGAPPVLALGDSFTLGAQVPEASTFEQRLGERLGVEVLNAGVDGYSTWQALERYRRLDAATQADRVLLTFFLGNDLTDNVNHARILEAAGRIDRPIPPGIGQGGLSRLLLRHSVIAAWWRVQTRRREMLREGNFEYQKFREEIAPFSVPEPERLRSLLEPSARALQALRDETHARGDLLWVAVAPPAFAMSASETEAALGLVGLSGAHPETPGKAVLALLSDLGIPACDLGDALAEASRRGQKPYLRFDGHWSDVGHAVVAERLAACLLAPLR